MRWDRLFDDLESQLERELSAEEVDLDAEEERLRLGRLSLRDRMVALQERRTDIGSGDTERVELTLIDGSRLSVHPTTVGRDWMSVDVLGESARVTQSIVPFASIAGISLDPSQVRASLAGSARDDAHPSLSARLGLPFVLRDLCRRRRGVDLVTTTGLIHATIDRVGRDHLDVAAHERGMARRASAVTELRIVPLAALLLVRL